MRIILEGLKGEDSITVICRREGIAPSLYYKWSKTFLQAGKRRLKGDTIREANSDEVTELRQENDQLKKLVAEFGPEKVTVAIDVDINESMPSGYEVYIDGGRTPTGADAVEWAKRVDGFGVPVILPTSKAGDGAQTGYDLPVIKAMASACSASIVASGGAGKMEHFYDAVEAGATILLAASVFHFHMIDILELKSYLQSQGVNVK